MIEIQPTAIPDVKIVISPQFKDDRGFFSEVYNSADLNEAGLDLNFVQDNHSWSARKGTVRGLHFQRHPFAQTKLIRVVRGRIFDVAVDIRRSSPFFGRHVAVELSYVNWFQLLIPAGFAHGFCTLEPDTDVVYKVAGHYSASHDDGLAWDDPDLGIAWPVERAAAILSQKDRGHPRLADLRTLFE